MRTLASYALLVKFRPKVKLKIKNLKLICDFSIAKSEGKKKVKITRFFIFGFHCVAKNIEG